MRISSTPYRIGLLALASLMVIFSAGLPIVIASCPMMKANADRGACCAHIAPRGLAQVHAVVNGSCCKTTLAADRNTNEYLQVSGCTGFIPQPAALVPLREVPLLHSGLLAIEQSPSPPNHGGDIPVFLSTLTL
jgi:hypothetical protein